MICTVSQISSGDQIEKNEMGLPCCMYGVEERWIQVSGGETWGKETTFKTRHSWNDNIKMKVEEIIWEGMDWIGLAQDIDKWQTHVNMVRSLWVLQNVKHFFSKQITTSF